MRLKKVVGKMKNSSGKWDVWCTSPIEVAYGPKDIETMFNT